MPADTTPLKPGTAARLRTLLDALDTRAYDTLTGMPQAPRMRARLLRYLARAEFTEAERNRLRDAADSLDPPRDPD